MASMKVALITGGAGAVGSATARMLAQDGFSVVLADIDIERAKAVCDEIRRDHDVDAMAVLTDLADLGSLKPLLGAISEKCGRLDCLVNNAGMTGASRIGTVDVEEWNSVLTINLTAPMLLCQEAIPLLRASGGASIVNVASRVYLSGTGVGYTSSKSGLIGLTRTLAVQLGKDRIRVNAVAPSFLNSPFNKKNVERNSSLADSFVKITPLGRLGTPDDVAGAIAFLASDRASFITGDILHVCGGAQLAPSPD
jgi:NAD(P)-dependent dehydrogenase (short-subunit alcohol dehydrogenase family)